jgi:ABC-type multidrug transport system fused ATPase/permease subunit
MNTILKIYNLLSADEKKRAYILMILILIMSVFDMLGIISIYPFLIVLTNPELIETNYLLKNIFTISESFGIYSVKQFLLYLGIIVFIIFISSLFFKAMTNLFIIRFVQMREYSFGRRLIEKYLMQSDSWFLDKHSGDLGKNILSEVNNVTERVLAPFINLIAQCAIILLILFFLLFINAKIAIISFLGFGLGYLTIYLLINKKLKSIGSENIKRNK